MGASREWYVNCDHEDGCDEELEYDGSMTLEEVREDVEANGWSIDEDGQEAYCEEHRKDKEEGEG